MTGKTDSTRSLSTRPDPSGPEPTSKRVSDPKPAPGLYLVATPIGNLGDISLRALDLVSRADVIACEDTRVTRKLLTAHGLRARLVAYHEHNAERVRPRLIEDIKCAPIRRSQTCRRHQVGAYKEVSDSSKTSSGCL